MYLKFDGKDVDPNDQEAQRKVRAEIEERSRIPIGDLLEAYRERFGGYPTTLHREPEICDEMREALRTGIPVKEPELPPGAVI